MEDGYKVKGLTGKNPSVFFRTYKLNRAAELIKEGTYTISEISGISCFSIFSPFPDHFSRYAISSSIFFSIH